MKWLGCFGLAIALLALDGCAAPAPAPPGPALVAPDAQDLLQDKAHAFQAGVVAGERLQARRDAAEVSSARAALIAETAAPSCPGPSPSAAPLAPAPAKPATSMPGSVMPVSVKPGAVAPGAVAPGGVAPTKSAPATTAPSYVPGGPAVPVAPAN